MENRRSNSCPVDPCKQESDLDGDFSKSGLVGQKKDKTISENTSNTEVNIRPSENNDLNRAKVNQWIDSKKMENEKTDTSSSSKLFHPQRRVALAIASESTGKSRPQMEPGRTRTQMISDDVKNLARQSVHDVASSSAGTGTEKEEVGADWVMVEKSTSDNAVMSCDPDDDSNVLVSKTNEESEKIKEILENGKLERTKMVMANKFGSTFKVLPEARAKVASTSGEGSSGKGTSSMGNIMTFATSITKWKQQRAAGKAKTGFALLDPDHRTLLQAESDSFKTEVPEAMMRTIKEEAYKIVLRTTQAYKSQIGSKHRLTQEAYECLKDLREELQRK